MIYHLSANVMWIVTCEKTKCIFINCIGIVIIIVALPYQEEDFADFSLATQSHRWTDFHFSYFEFEFELN